MRRQDAVNFFEVNHMIHPWHDVTPGERLPSEFNSFREASELPPHRLMMLRRFFQDYKQLQGKSVEVDEFQASSTALPVIEESLQRYSEHRRRGFH